MTYHSRVTDKHTIAFLALSAFDVLPNGEVLVVPLTASAGTLSPFAVMTGMQTLRTILLRFPRNRCRALYTDQQTYGLSLSLLQTPFVPFGSARRHATSNAPRLDEHSRESVSAVEESQPRAPSRPSSIKKLNQALARRKTPELVEADLEEQFVRGMSKDKPARIICC